MTSLHIAGLGLAACCAVALLVWVASVPLRDVSIVDSAWSLLVLAPVLVALALAPQPGPRAPWLALLAGAWALRLAVYITWRHWGQPEDPRYQEIRARNEPGFAMKSLYLVFALQAVLAWIVAAPFLVGMASGRPFAVLDAIGAATGAFGIAFEAVGDA